MSVNKKKLPKAIRHTADELREAATGHGARQKRDPPARPADSGEPADGGAAAPDVGRAGDIDGAAPVLSQPVTGALAPTAAETDVAPDVGRAGDIDGAAPVLSQPVTGALAPTASETDVARRRSRARAIVERHATYSAFGGIIPLPIVNVASITAVIVRMVKVLSDLYGVPFERDRARAIVVGLMGGAMPTGLAAVTASTLVYIVPGSNLIGLAVSSITAIACTRGIGRVFIEHFESGATLPDISAAEGR